VETPRSTIKEFLKILPNQKELEYNAVNLRKVEEQLMKAFAVFHHKLRLLKSFSFLNVLAFSKIVKKYDKFSGRSASKPYMKMVDNSYLGSSDEVTKLIERVEATFIKHFANGNRSKGMNILRPKPRRERHRTTFSLGFLAGGTAALVLALVLVIRTRYNLENESGHKSDDDRYMSTMFPLYSLFGYVVLHMIMYAANIYFWRRYRVNYSFIFGFKEGSALGYKQVLLVGFGLSLLALACVLSNLDMQIDPRTGNYKAFTELLPLGLVVLVFAVLFCPFNIIYRSSRYFLLTCLLHCVAAPLYKVVLPDFFLADQLTSQVQAIRSLQFYICYYVSGHYRARVTDCKDLPVFKIFIFIVAGLPYLMRLLQCLRRWYEEKDIMQGLNGVKYLLTIIAVLTRIAFSLNENWKLVAWISSIIAMLFGIYWDLVFDWGLLDRNSKNWMLRDKLLVPYKSVYFIAMVLNTVLRLAWLQTVLKFRIDFMHTELMILVVACLEILRRGLWNFFRLENEHLNNVGKYRAFKSVPLPFNYGEDEEDKDD
jgi:hypothetical protein